MKTIKAEPDPCVAYAVLLTVPTPSPSTIKQIWSDVAVTGRPGSSGLVRRSDFDEHFSPKRYRLEWAPLHMRQVLGRCTTCGLWRQDRRCSAWSPAAGSRRPDGRPDPVSSTGHVSVAVRLRGVQKRKGRSCPPFLALFGSLLCSLLRQDASIVCSVGEVPWSACYWNTIEERSVAGKARLLRIRTQRSAAGGGRVK